MKLIITEHPKSPNIMDFTEPSDHKFNVGTIENQRGRIKWLRTYATHSGAVRFSKTIKGNATVVIKNHT